MDTHTTSADAPRPIKPPVTDSTRQRFADLVLRYHAYLYSYARWLCADPAIAEDLVQEVFLRAWSARESLRDANAARSWLVTILRRENARRFECYRPPEIYLELDALPGKRVTFDTSTEAIVLRRTIAELPEAYREPLLLQVLGGYACDEIAEMLELSPTAVMARLLRARRRLRAVLGESAHDAEWALSRGENGKTGL